MRALSRQVKGVDWWPGATDGRTAKPNLDVLQGWCKTVWSVPGLSQAQAGNGMIVMLDTPQDLDVCSKELGCEVEQLFTPLTRRSPQQPEKRFAMDNGAFAQFEAGGFMSMLSKHKPRRDLCRFVAVPDVVGSARRTLECFRCWQPRLEGWPIAFVCQDGQEDIEVPWDCCEAVFIGGSTEWKMGGHAAAIVKAAKVIGKWCHIGRINTPGRFEYFEKLGADSCDGTGLAQYSHMRKAIYEERIQPRLAILDEPNTANSTLPGAVAAGDIATRTP